MKIPDKKSNPDLILQQLKDFQKADYKYNRGRLFGLVYYLDEEHSDFLKAAHNEFLSQNFLNPMAFDSIKRMENEVVQMMADLMGGNDQTVGVMTSGGTESILMAVKAARDLAKKRRPFSLKTLEVLAPCTAHVAFEKACKYFGLRYRTYGLDKSYRADLKSLQKLISSRTALIVGSAPQYVQGVIDPIEKMAAIAQEKEIPFHVDACIGGMMLPWLEKLGEEIPPWNLSVPGVTSLSVDLHKYGMAAKGASVILYKSMNYMKHQFFISTNWPGGIYASPTFPGTRSGGPIAAAWATLNKFGNEGYLELASKTLAVKKEFISCLLRFPELEILGEPQSSLISIQSLDPEIDIYVLADLLNEKGWFMDRQQRPEALHFTLMPIHHLALSDFFEDLAESITFARANPALKGQGNAAMYGMMAKIPLRSMVKMSVEKAMEGLWGREGQVPNLDNLADGPDASIALKIGKKYQKQIDKALEQLNEAKNSIQKFKKNRRD